MFKLKEIVETRKDDLAKLITLEHGKTFDDALGEVGRGLEVIEFACGIPSHLAVISQVMLAQQLIVGPITGLLVFVQELHLLIFQ